MKSNFKIRRTVDSLILRETVRKREEHLGLCNVFSAHVFGCSNCLISPINSFHNHRTCFIKYCGPFQNGITVRNRSITLNVDVSSNVSLHLNDRFTIFEVLLYCKHELLETPHHVTN